MQFVPPNRLFDGNEKDCALDLHRLGVFRNRLPHGLRPEFENPGLLHPFCKLRRRGEYFTQNQSEGIHPLSVLAKPQDFVKIRFE